MLRVQMPEAPGDAQPDRGTAARGSGLDRLASFRVTYLSIFAFMALYVVTIEGVERALHAHFHRQVDRATLVNPADGPLIEQIQQRVGRLVRESPWVRIGGVRLNVTVLAADGLTPIYVGGGVVASPPRSLDAELRQALRLLPAISDVFVSVPHGSLLSVGVFVGYGAVLLQGLFLYHRRVARHEQQRLLAAMAARDQSASRARTIEEELSKVRERLREVEPAERSQAEEIRQLERERTSLRAKLRELGERESALRRSASRVDELEEERQALEELLDEALEDVGHKEGEIATLQESLKSASRRETAAGKGRSREAERIAKRMRTLYKRLHFEERALADLAALGDESLKLRAEEALKRLDEDPDTAAVRRKVGGLPPGLSIFELGFAGKGRIYYARGERGYQVLAIGGKATQKQDLEYLSRLA